MTNQHVPSHSSTKLTPPASLQTSLDHCNHTHTLETLFIWIRIPDSQVLFKFFFFEYTALGSSSGSTLGVSANLTTQSPQSVFLCKIKNKNYVNKLIMLTKKIPSKLSYVKLVCNEFFEIRRINQFFLKTIIFSTLPCLHFSIFAIYSSP